MTRRLVGEGDWAAGGSEEADVATGVASPGLLVAGPALGAIGRLIGDIAGPAFAGCRPTRRAAIGHEPGGEFAEWH